MLRRLFKRLIKAVQELTHEDYEYEEFTLRN